MHEVHVNNCDFPDDAGAVFNLATVVVFILGLFTTLVINRWWSIRTARTPLALSNSASLFRLHPVSITWKTNELVQCAARPCGLSLCACNAHMKTRK